MQKRWLALLVTTLFFGGSALFFYPILSDWLAARHHTTAISTYTHEVGALDAAALEQHRLAAEAYNRRLTGAAVEDPFLPGSGMVAGQEYWEIMNIGGSMGYLEIPKIGISLPIYHGTGEDSLRKGVGHLDATALPIGGPGNHSVLTGHRGLPSARLFTDLDRLETGDLFYLYTLGQALPYQVDQILVIDPTDTGSLRTTAGEDYVSLITCTPYAVNSHRLVVRGVRLAENGNPQEEPLSEDALPVSSPGNPIALIRILALSAAGLPVLGLTALALILKNRKGVRLWRQKK